MFWCQCELTAESSVQSVVGVAQKARSRATNSDEAFRPRDGLEEEGRVKES